MTIAPPPSLVQHVCERRCILFAGAGLSAWAKLPTWPALLRELIEATRNEDPSSPSYEELLKLLEKDRMLDVADHCREKLGKRLYHQILETHLRGETEPIPEPHRIIARLPFSAIVTTNFDRLLERAYAEENGTIPKAPTHADHDSLGPLLFSDSFFVLKAHGDIQRPDSLVLTARDFRELIHANAGFNACFSAVLMTNAVLFVGYSLNDPDFRLLLDQQLTAFRGHVPDRYAIMSGVGPVERDVLWRTAQIRVISYEDGKHDELLTFLRTLHEAVQKNVTTNAKASAGAPTRVLSATANTPSSRTRAAAPPRATHTTVEQASLPITTLHVRLRDRRIATQISGPATPGGDTSVPGSEPRPSSERRDGDLTRSDPVPWDMIRDAVAATLGEFFPTPEQCAELGRLLASLLPEQRLLEIPTDHVVQLVVDRELEALPWEMVYVGDRHLCRRNPVVRAPMGVAEGVRGVPLLRKPTKLLLIGNPTWDVPLPGAQREVEEIDALYTGREGFECLTLVGKDASFANVVRELRSGDYDIVHFAGHAWFDEFESYLSLDDESTRVSSSELYTFLCPRPPAILMLNSHYTAFIPTGVRIAEKLPANATSGRAGPHRDALAASPAMPAPVTGDYGFTKLATTTGVGAFIGCFGSPEDNAARRLAVAMHQQLLEGVPIARALHAARATAPRSATDTSALVYSLSGLPDFVIVERGAARRAATRRVGLL